MLEFLPLASSSAGCCYRLSGGGTSAPILIDAGIRFRDIQVGVDFKVSQLAGALISHAHGDHVKSVSDLQREGVDVYASSETWNQLGSYASHHRAKVLKELEETQIGDWTVKPFLAEHDLPGTFGFVIGSPDGCRALYLTDSAYSRYTFDGLTHIYVECNFSSEILRDNVERKKIDPVRYQRTTRTHMSIERLIDMLKKNDLSKVEEIHLLHLSSANSNEVEFKLKVQQATGKPVYIAAERSVKA